MNAHDVMKIGGGLVIAVFLAGCLLLIFSVLGITGSQLPLLVSGNDDSSPVPTAPCRGNPAKGHSGVRAALTGRQNESDFVYLLEMRMTTIMKKTRNRTPFFTGGILIALFVFLITITGCIAKEKISKDEAVRIALNDTRTIQATMFMTPARIAAPTQPAPLSAMITITAISGFLMIAGLKKDLELK